MNDSIEILLKYTALEHEVWADSGKNLIIVNKDDFLLNNKNVPDITVALDQEFPKKLPPILVVTDSETSFESINIVLAYINERGTELLIVRNIEGYSSRN